jgi:GGDEF domain-containing protein
LICAHGIGACGWHGEAIRSRQLSSHGAQIMHGILSDIGLGPEHFRGKVVLVTGQDGKTLLRKADAAMYAAKNSGRNNVRFSLAD